MIERHLHIVCLDVPYPPDYGGAADMFYKIKALSELGIKIILHCFEYGRGKQKTLEKYCVKVYYYPRSIFFPVSIPYIVGSRKNTLLSKRLIADDFPVLLEGIHSTYYLFDKTLSKKNVSVRIHNVEHIYYQRLASVTRHLLKRFYYEYESRLLRKYEKRLDKNATLFFISKKDEDVLTSSGVHKHYFLPAFTGNARVTSLQGKGSYCLYHGNLSITENEGAALFLITDVFSVPVPKLPLIIAGKHPSRRLIRLCRERGIRLISDPGDDELEELIRNAHIHLLPSLNMTGVKIKLLNALFKGRFVITNQDAIGDDRLRGVCMIANSPADYWQKIDLLSTCVFSEAAINTRQEILARYFNPQKNAETLIRVIFNQSE